jgi:hypothetical protein
MVDHFASPRLTISRAQHHIDDLTAKINEFVTTQPWSHAVEQDLTARQDVHRIRFARRLPDDLPCIVFDAANNLRAVLDQSGYASAIASGKVDPKGTQFPFGDDLAGIEKTVIGRGRCKDLPPEILTLFMSFNPYKGGNNALWALNKLCNAKKHCALVPFDIGRANLHSMQVTQLKPVFRDDGMVDLTYQIKTKGFVAGMSRENPDWDPDKYEITLARFPLNESPNYQARVALNVTFDGVETQRGKPAVLLLREMMGIVDRILSVTEAECRRLGFIK